ncbi:MAG: hypothetical protein ACK4SQ_14500 [Allorhizobium sp.]
MILTLYKIEDMRSSRLWNCDWGMDPMTGGFIDGDENLLTFDDYEEAERFADQVGGIVEVHRAGTFGNRFAIGGGIQQAAE